MGKKAPSAPDPAETAAAQGSWNSFTAQQNQAMNMVGQNTPWGTLDYQQTGTTTIIDPNGKEITVPQFTANVGLSPSQQAIFDQTQKAQGNLANIAADQSAWLQEYMSKGVDASGAPALQTSIDGLQTQLGDGYATSYAGADDFSADRQRVEDALWERSAGQRAQDESALRTTLINQGIRPGTARWDSEMARLSSANNDARLATIAAAGQEQSRLVGLAQNAAAFGNDAITNRFQLENAAAGTAANFNNQARSQALSEAYAARNQPLNEIAALMSGSQVQNPTSSFASTPQVGVGGVDYSGLVNQKYQADMANYQAQMGGIGGLFGTAMSGLFGLSDRRAKTDIRRIGQTDAGTPIYVYRYKSGGPMQMGVMAQDIEETQPHAVATHPSGLKMVDYGAVA